jgi:two-component system NarL family sensor kinase
MRKLVYIFILLSLICTKLSASNSIDTNSIKQIFIEAMEYQDYDNDSSWLLAEKGFELSRKTNYKAGIGMAFMRFGALMNLKGKSDSALFYFKQAFSIRKELNNTRGMAAICQQISYVFRNTGKKDSAFFYLYEAQRLFDKTKDSVAIASIYVELANLNTTYENYSISINYLIKALPIFIKNNDEALEYQTYIEFGVLYFKQDEFKKALYYYLKAKYINDNVLENPSYTAGLYNYIGLCYDEMGDKTKAIDYFNKAINEYTDLEMYTELAMLEFNLGNLHIGIKQANEGIYHLEKAKKIAIENQDQYRLSRCYELLSDAYALKGDYLKAYNYYVLHANISDSLLNLEKVKQIAEMNVLYETEKKVQEIELLNAENNLKEARNKLLLIGSVFLLIGIIVLIYIYIQRTRIAKKNEEIAQQKIKNLINEQEIKTIDAMMEGQEEERKRIAVDLHDRLGSMLSTVKLLFSALDSKIDRALDENKQQYTKANQLLDEACAEVRRISHNLSTGMVSNFGLRAALEELSDSIDNSGLITCKLNVYGLEERLNTKLEIAIYRMTQEIINNILKHAKATKISIQLNKTDESISISIEDNGIGFNVEEKKKSGGLGLASIEARAIKEGGTYHIDSNIGKGTISIIELPIN